MRISGYFINRILENSVDSKRAALMAKRNSLLDAIAFHKAALGNARESGDGAKAGMHAAMLDFYETMLSQLPGPPPPMQQVITEFEPQDQEPSRPKGGAALKAALRGSTNRALRAHGGESGFDA